MVANRATTGICVRLLLPSLCLVTCAHPIRAQNRQGNFTETEPNDDMVSAQDLGVLAPGLYQIENGSIANGAHIGRDVDLFKLRVAPEAVPALITVESVRTPMLDAYVRVFDAEGFQLAANDDVAYPNTDARVSTFLLGEGEYYIGFSDARSSGYFPQVAGTGAFGPKDGTYELWTLAVFWVLPCPF